MKNEFKCVSSSDTLPFDQPSERSQCPLRPLVPLALWPLAPFGPLGPLALAAPKGEVLNIQNGARTNHSFGIAFGA